ncbi:DUF6746 family protein [Denitrobaculum tricleocarpae]|nr:DUF6746 family protein [Denitrobaculum tricleocarpae]
MISRTGRHLTLAAALAVGLCAVTAGRGHAEERVDHYAAREPANLQEAVMDFSAFNEKVAAVLARSELGSNDFEEIHELTYTLENALARIRGDLKDLADTLEALHLASEEHQSEATRAHGTAYLKTARTVVP